MKKVEELKAKGNGFFEAGDNVGASAAYTEALALCEEDDDRNTRRILHSNRSAARLKAGDAEGALSDADMCLELGPGWSKGLGRRGMALLALGRFEDSCRAFEQAALFGDLNNQSFQENLERAKSALKDPLVADKIKQELNKQIQSQTTQGEKTAPKDDNDELSAFLEEVAEIESSKKRARVTLIDHDAETEGWSSVNQIERILQKHHKFFNLNPYHVFGIGHQANEEDIKKRYRYLNLLVHPDKNLSEPRARDAFEYVQKAYNELMDENRRSLLLETFDVCRATVERARAASLQALGNREDLLIEREGTFEFAFDREIKRVFGLNEQNRIRAEQIRTANETHFLNNNHH